MFICRARRSHVDPPRKGETIYHRRQFSLTPDAHLSAALCEDCHDQLQYASAHLHRQCALKLRKALDRALPRAKNSRKRGKKT